MSRLLKIAFVVLLFFGVANAEDLVCDITSAVCQSSGEGWRININYKVTNHLGRKAFVETKPHVMIGDVRSTKGRQVFVAYSGEIKKAEYVLLEHAAQGVGANFANSIFGTHVKNIGNAQIKKDRDGINSFDVFVLVGYYAIGDKDLNFIKKKFLVYKENDVFKIKPK